MNFPAIENLYYVFRKYTLNEKVTGHYCAVCLSEEDNIYFHSTSLKQISSLRLSNYFTSVGILEGNLNDYKYFLPRILELAYINEDDGSSFFEYVWKRLAEANYTQWNTEDILAINTFLEFYLEKYIQSKDEKQIKWAIGNLEEIGYNGKIDLKNVI